MAAVQVDAGLAQVDGRYRRHSPIGIQARRIWAFAHVIVQVELDGDALGDAGPPESGVRPIAESAARRSHGRVADSLDTEGEAVGGGGTSRQLEAELRVEVGNVDRFGG